MGAVTEYYYRKSGQIPAFGDWENANELPITQYFECARQAGLLRCSCSGECCGNANKAAAHLINSLPRRVYTVPAPAPHRKAKTRGMNKGYPQSNLERKQVQVKVGELMNQPRSHKHHPKTAQNMIKSSNTSAKPKPVDEDLYKIPPELLQNSKRKKVMLGFFSKCMVPPCAA